MKRIINLSLIEFFYLTASLICTLGIIGFIYYINHFGLDFSDESFYAIGYKYSIEPTHPSLYHRVYNYLFADFGLDLLSIRHLRLCLTCSSAILLAYSFLTYLRQNKIEITLGYRITIFIATTIGSLLSYTFAPLTLSYNSISTITFNALLAFWLLSVVSKTNPKRTIIFALISGAIIGIMFYNKITNSILILLALPIFDYLLSIKLNNKNIKNFLLFWSTTILSFTISIILIRDDNYSITENFLRYFEVFQSENMDSTYSKIYLLDKYYQNTQTLLKNTWVYIVTIATFLVLIKKRRITEKKMAIATSILIFIVLTAFILINQSINGGTFRVYSIFEMHFLMLSVGVLLFFIGPRSEKNNQTFFFGLIFLAIPFIGTAGTNNGLTALFMYYMSFISLATFIFIRNVHSLVRYTLLGVLLFISMFQIYTASITYPYRQESIFPHKMTTVDNIPFLNGLSITSEHQKLIQEIDFVKDKGVNQIMTYAELGGISLLLDIKPYCFGWLRYKKDKFNCFILGREPKCNSKTLVIILPKSQPLTNDFQKCLIQKGIDFKNDFVLVKEVKHFCYVYNENQTLGVYLHK